ncbi:MAG: hypothetical protein BWK72_14450 [Rhodoferax ferrireducens]|uniref:DUF5615 domain-containing protein n=1 Tax=Rhodoferax ferrireducens TaxID=192843 RepID=A0A1W9KS59_9BURK|nr:MAG: hypothetical protein BWK72_14450 [Rhodoferax ferrireducens]
MKLLLDENLQHDYPGSDHVVMLGMESASDTQLWEKAKQDGFVIVTRAATLKVLIANRDMIVESLERDGKASVELLSRL